MKPKTMVLIAALFSIWLGFSILSSVMISTINTISATNPIVPWIGLGLFVGGLIITYKISRPIFNDLTKMSKFLGVLRGKQP